MQQTESLSELYTSDLSLLKADAYDVKISGAQIRTMTCGSESECVTHYTTAPKSTCNLYEENDFTKINFKG